MPTRMLLLLLGLAVPLRAPAAAAPAADARGTRACLECHADKTLAKTNAAGQAISLYVDGARYTNSVHRTNACVSCHADVGTAHPDDKVAAQPVDCAVCHATPTETYGEGAHALALKAGKEGAATCVDCHGKHDMLPPTSPESPLHFTRLTATCGECHADEAAQVAESVHGKSAAAGHREAPTCLDCHAEHRIEDLRTVSAGKLAERICSRCHASERLNTKYRLPGDRVRTFMESYHGLASQYGSTRAANCASCHGVHRILRSTDPRSSIYPTNLVATCGKCHPGATANFAASRVHPDATASDLGSRVNFWVRRVYLGLIFGTIGLMATHHFLSWRRRALAAFYSPDRTVLRMDSAQRWQHLLLALCFCLLAVTGFALKFPDSWLAHLLGSDESFRRLTHRVAGTAMLLLGVYHVMYVAMSKEGRRLLGDLMPRAGDVRDLRDNLSHFLFHGRPRPKFGRFGYPEKLEYWAVVWGTMIMGATGLMIWFKLAVTRLLPGWVVEVATTVHYYEAILACAAILVWHFYHVMFDPATAPMNWAWWDGKVSSHWHRHEHPRDEPDAGAPDTRQPGEEGTR